MDIDYSHYIVSAGIGWLGCNIYRFIKVRLHSYFFSRRLRSIYGKDFGSGCVCDYDFDSSESDTPIGDRLAKEMGL